MSRSVAFGYSLRKGMDEENPDNKKRSTGPGSYEFAGCFDHLSEYAHKEANRFACAPRQSMAVKTPSPGAVYNIEKKYYLGPEKSMGIGFANASRAPMNGKSVTANADMFIPKPETGSAITIAGRPKVAKFLQTPTPGAIYDVHVRLLPLNRSTLCLSNAVVVHRNELISEQAPRILLEKARPIDSGLSGFFLNQMIDQETVESEIDFVVNILVSCGVVLCSYRQSKPPFVCISYHKFIVAHASTGSINQWFSKFTSPCWRTDIRLCVPVYPPNCGIGVPTSTRGIWHSTHRTNEK
jgi:hypothetical protein